MCKFPSGLIFFSFLIHIDSNVLIQIFSFVHLAYGELIHRIFIGFGGGGGRFFRIDELRFQLCFVYILYQHVRVMLIKSDWGLSTIHVELICKEI